MNPAYKQRQVWVDQVPADYAAIADQFGTAGSREWATAVLLVGALEVGTSIKPLREHTGVSWKYVTHGSWYLGHNGVWHGQQLRYAWNEPGLSRAEWRRLFELDVQAGCGYIRYVDDDGTRDHRPAQWGDFSRSDDWGQEEPDADLRHLWETLHNRDGRFDASIAKHRKRKARR